MRTLLPRLRSLFLRDRLDAALDEEIRTHLEQLAAAYEAKGMSPGEARCAARRAFGGIEPMKEQHRDQRRLPWLEDVVRDVRYALRTLGRSPGFAAIAVLTLALGIGTNTALFAVLYGYLFEPAPIRDPESLVALRWEGENAFRQMSVEHAYVAGRESGRVGGTLPVGAFRELQKGSRTLSGVAALAQAGDLNVVADGVSETVSGQFVSGELFNLLGINAAHGRLIAGADDAEAAPAVVVLSHGYWVRRFGGTTAIAGKAIAINGVPFTVAGVTAASFRDVSRRGFPEPPDVAIPLVHEPRVRGGESDAMLRNPAAWWLTVIGRRRPDVTIAQVEASLAGLLGRAIAAYGPTLTAEQLATQPRVKVVTAGRGLADPASEVIDRLWILASVAIVVLLVVCVNISNLLLSRTVGRGRELAVRRAIGATGGRLRAQLMTEAAALALVSGCAAVVLALASRALLGAFVGDGVSVRIWSGPTLAFAGVLAALTALAFGAIPALRATAAGSATLVRESAAVPVPRARLGKALLVVQVALSLPLLFAAGLFLRTLGNLRAVDVGFDPANIVLFTLEPELRGYDRVRAAALYERVSDQLMRVPGVRAVTTSGFGTTLMDGGTTVMAMGESADTPMLAVDANYFATLGLSLKRGRLFDASDTPASTRVAIVNETFVKRHFPDRDPIGQLFHAGFELQIVGVVADALVHGLRAPPPPTFYRPLTQLPLPGRRVVVRTAGNPGALIPAIRAAVRAVEPNLPLQDMATQSEAIEANYLADERIFATASTAVGVLVLAVTMIGLFGLMSYAVARRTKELGLHMALGAQRSQLLGSVLREALVVTGTGTAIGALAALGVGQLLRAQVFGLSGHDPVTLAAVALLMLTAAAAAAAVPAMRAATIDPVVALRSE